MGRGCQKRNQDGSDTERAESGDGGVGRLAGTGGASVLAGFRVSWKLGLAAGNQRRSRRLLRQGRRQLDRGAAAGRRGRVTVSTAAAGLQAWGKKNVGWPRRNGG